MLGGVAVYNVQNDEIYNDEFMFLADQSTEASLMETYFDKLASGCNKWYAGASMKYA